MAVETWFWDLLLKSWLILSLGGIACLVSGKLSAARRHFVLHCWLVGLATLPVAVWLWSLAPGDALAIPILPQPAGADGAGRGISEFLVLLWLAGTAAHLMRLAWVWAAWNGIARRAVPQRDPNWLKSERMVRRRLGLTRSIPVCLSPEAPVALVVGLRRPCILLPSEACRWGAARRELTLLHELAHVQRRDNHSNWLGQLTVALHWFNPLVRWIVKQLIVQRERACDDRVLRAGVRASDYAQHLLELVQAREARESFLVTSAVSERSVIKERILAILNPDRPRSPISRQSRVRLALGGALTLLMVAGLHPWFVQRLAQEVLSSLGTASRISSDASQPAAWSESPESGKHVNPPSALPRRPGDIWTRRGPDQRPTRRVIRVGVAGSEGTPALLRHKPGTEHQTGQRRPTGRWVRPATPYLAHVRFERDSNRPPAARPSDSPPTLPASQTELNPDPDAVQPAPEKSIERVELGTLGGTMSRALAINQAGEVVGKSTTREGQTHAFIWSPQTGIQDLGNPGNWAEMAAVDINDAGAVLLVGSDRDGSSRSYVYSARLGPVDLGHLGGAQTTAAKLNNEGQAIGNATSDQGRSRAFFWSLDTGMVDLGGERAVSLNQRGEVIGQSGNFSFWWSQSQGFRLIGPLGAQVRVAAINEKGWVVGSAKTGLGPAQAFLWHPEQGFYLLGYLRPEHRFSAAFKVNDRLEVVGFSAASALSVGESFLWTPGLGMQALDFALPVPRGWTNSGLLVSDSRIPIGSSEGPVVWSSRLGMIALETDASGSRAEAIDVNERGQVAGNVFMDDGYRAVRWNVPLESPASAPPQQ